MMEKEKQRSQNEEKKRVEKANRLKQKEREALEAAEAKKNNDPKDRKARRQPAGFIAAEGDPMALSVAWPSIPVEETFVAWLCAVHNTWSVVP